ncbi:LysE family translocator [Pseudonocardia kongjuensis]|uniref:LysE family translocator n=1 Tax=Pseudonocardia kongjuensis TaxID=102227 RepID=A0ABN1Y4M3_9PSEU
MAIAYRTQPTIPRAALTNTQFGSSTHVPPPAGRAVHEPGRYSGGTGNPRTPAAPIRTVAGVPSAATTVAFLLGSLVFVVMPGPSVLFIVGRAVALGRRAALVTVAGNLAGVLVIVVLVALGIGTVVERSAVVLTVLKFAGAAYLVVLGVRAWRHRGDRPGPTGVVAAGAGRRVFREGLVVGVTNPKAIVFFAAVLPQFVDPTQGTTTGQMLVLGLLFCALASVVDVGWALGAGAARDWFARSPGRLRATGGAGGLMLVGLGIGVAATGRSG